jgi:hypothetical protein
MQNSHTPIRVVFYQDDGVWVAHCLEFDLMGDGATKGLAMDRLGEAIALQAQASLDHDNLDNLFRPADGKLFAMFAAGRGVSEGELRLRLGSVSIDLAEAREYDPVLVPDRPASEGTRVASAPAA